MPACRFASIAAAFVIGHFALADQDRCFDFRQKVEKALRPPPALNEALGTIEWGREESPVRDWASGRGIVPKSIDDTLAWLLDHRNWKDMKKTRLTVKESYRPGYFAFHTVDVVVRVWAFIQIGWVEEWAFALISGTPLAANHWLISYQKIEGTPHLERLCGSVELRRVKQGTDLYFYEEARAERYRRLDIARMQRGNLEILGASVPPEALLK